MKSLKTRIALAALVAATAMGANAADEPQKPQNARLQQAAATSNESAQFEFFENEMQRMSVPSYTPAEHPDRKPELHSEHPTPSVFDNPLNQSSLG